MCLHGLACVHVHIYMRGRINEVALRQSYGTATRRQHGATRGWRRQLAAARPPWRAGGHDGGDGITIWQQATVEGRGGGSGGVVESAKKL